MTRWSRRRKHISSAVNATPTIAGVASGVEFGLGNWELGILLAAATVLLEYVASVLWMDAYDAMVRDQKETT